MDIFSSYLDIKHEYLINIVANYLGVLLVLLVIFKYIYSRYRYRYVDIH